jgi:hypothetical protein
MIKKLIVGFFVTTLVFGCFVVNSFAASACGAELCLSSYKAAKIATECREEIDAFFKISGKKHGDFSPSRTYSKRRKYLYKCDSGNTKQKEAILSAYGYLESKP